MFGGFTPAVATYLIEKTGNRASPALWLSLAAAISLTAAVLTHTRRTGVLPAIERGTEGDAYGRV